MLLNAALQGFGITQLSDFYVQHKLVSGELISVLDSFRISYTSVWAVYPNNNHLSPKVWYFVDFLASLFERCEYGELYKKSGIVNVMQNRE